MEKGLLQSDARRYAGAIHRFTMFIARFLPLALALTITSLPAQERLKRLGEIDWKDAEEVAVGADLPAVFEPVVVAEALAGKLVKLDGEKLVAHKLDAEKAMPYFLLYYSAGWSQTCKTFTPALIEFYREQKGAGTDFEIVFVSVDDGEKQMQQYMADTKMPWPALRFADREALEFVKSAKGRGVPCLSVLDSRGLILAHSYKRRTEYLGVEKPLEEFAKMLAELEGEAEEKPDKGDEGDKGVRGAAVGDDASGTE